MPQDVVLIIVGKQHGQDWRLGQAIIVRTLPFDFEFKVIWGADVFEFALDA